MKNPPDPFFGVAAVGAASVAGIALWISRASFDVAGTTAQPVRVAMLPSLAELMGLIVVALLIAAGLAAFLRSTRNRARTFWGAATEPLLPLFALLLLALPYLPWLADWIPGLRLLAGPARFLIWVVVVGSMLWILLPPLAPSKAAAIFGAGFGGFQRPVRAQRKPPSDGVRRFVSDGPEPSVGQLVAGADRQPGRVVRPGVRDLPFRARAASCVCRARRHAAGTIAPPSGDWPVRYAPCF